MKSSRLVWNCFILNILKKMHKKCTNSFRVGFLIKSWGRTGKLSHECIMSHQKRPLMRHFPKARFLTPINFYRASVTSKFFNSLSIPFHISITILLTLSKQLDVSSYIKFYSDHNIVLITYLIVMLFYAKHVTCELQCHISCIINSSQYFHGIFNILSWQFLGHISLVKMPYLSTVIRGHNCHELFGTKTKHNLIISKTYTRSSNWYNSVHEWMTKKTSLGFSRSILVTLEFI